MAGGRALGAKLARRSLGLWATGLGLVALAVSGLFGGLARQDEQPPVAGMNVVVDGGPWTVTITGGRLVNELKPMRLSDPGNRWVVVLAKVEVTSDETWYNIGSILHLSNVDGVDPKKKADGVVRMKDASRQIMHLNPGIPEDFAFFFEQPAGAKPPTKLTVLVDHYTWREDSITKEMGWRQDYDKSNTRDVMAGEIEVPVVDKREAPASPSASPSAVASATAKPSGSAKPTASAKASSR